MNYKNPMENLYGVCSYKKGDIITRWELSWLDGCGRVGLHSIELGFEIIQITDEDMERCIKKAELTQSRIKENFDEFKVLYRKMVDISNNTDYNNVEKYDLIEPIVKEIKEEFCE